MMEIQGNLLITLSMSNIIVKPCFLENWNGRVFQIILYTV